MRGFAAAFVVCIALAACTSPSERGPGQPAERVEEALFLARDASIDGWTIRVSVQPAELGPVFVSVGRIRSAPESNSRPWIQHELVLENRGDRPIRFADTRTSAFIGPRGHRALLAADEGCGWVRSGPSSAIEAGACLTYLDALRVAPHSSVSRTITLFKGLRGMRLTGAIYVFEKPIWFQPGTEVPEEGAGRRAILRLVYKIEAAAVRPTKAPSHLSTK